MPPEGRIGIQALLLRVFLPVVVAVALVLAIFVNNRLNAAILDQFDKRLIATSALTGALIDPADHDWLIGEAAVGRDPAKVERDPRYRRNVEPMRRIRARLGLTYNYTQVTDGAGGIRYILDGTEGDDHTPLGSPDTLPADTMAGLRDVQAKGRVYVSPVEYQEQWGLLKTAAAPVYGAGGRISGTAGADVNVSVIRVATQRALFLSAMIGIASLLACLLVALQIVRRVARPIERLTQEALRIAAGDHRPPADIASPHEVGNLRASLAQLNRHVTAELEDAEARAARHRLAASETWLIGGTRGQAAVVLADTPQRLVVWLAYGTDAPDEALAGRAMLGLRDRIAADPRLIDAIERLADLDRGALLAFDRAARRLSLAGAAPVELESNRGALTVAPGEGVDLPAGAAELRYRGVVILRTDGGGR